jgi:hypothetical protein
LLVFSPFGERHFAHQLRPNPLDSFGNLERILDRWLVGEESLQAAAGIFESLFAETGDYSGLMFWLTWKKLFGSYFLLTSVNRS